MGYGDGTESGTEAARHGTVRSPAWYVVQVQPARDYRARDALRITAGFSRAQIFLAEYVEWQIYRGDVRSKFTGPLFPTYLFLRFVPAPEAWQRLVHCPFITRLMCDAGRPVAIECDPRTLAATARARFGYGDRDDPPPGRRRWDAGDRVCVAEGPLAGMTGTVKRVTVHDRLKILFDAMASGALVDIADTTVTAATLA